MRLRSANPAMGFVRQPYFTEVALSGPDRHERNLTQTSVLNLVTQAHGQSCILTV